MLALLVVWNSVCFYGIEAKMATDFVVVSETFGMFEVSTIRASSSAEAASRVPGRVIGVAPNIEYQAAALPSDPLFVQQEHLQVVSASNVGIDVVGAWQTTQGDPGVVVAVVDSGVRPHNEYRDRLLPGWDFVDRDSNSDDPGDGGYRGCQSSASSWHGTHVTGLIASSANGTGVVGVAPKVKILPVRALGACGVGSLDGILDGVLWAAGIPVAGAPANPYPADVINLSLGGFGACTALEQAVYAMVAEKGIVVVAAAGNERSPASYSSPANCRNTFTVGASLSRGTRSSFSNYGDVVDIYAPGGGSPSGDGQGGVLSTIDAGYQRPKGDDFDRMSGTSMAAPVLAGVAALMKSVKPEASINEIVTALKSTVTPCRDGSCPQGIVNASAALGYILKSPGVEAPLVEVAPVVVLPQIPQADPNITQERYGGSSPTEIAESTARYVAFRHELAGNTQPLEAVLASETSFADGLTASVYAGHVSGVILFTDPNRIPTSTIRALQDLKVPKITIIGGPAAVSEAVEQGLQSRGFRVERIWGANRYETANAVSEKVVKNKKYLFVASGRNFADAVAVGPVTYYGAFPMVLASAQGLDQSSQDLIITWKRLNPQGSVVILGGTAAVPGIVETQLASLKRPFEEADGYFGGEFCDNYPASWPSCPTDFVPMPIAGRFVVRLGGADRFDTAGRIAKWATSSVFPAASSDVGFASGATFTDALAAASLMGQKPFQGPLLLMNLCARVPKSTLDASQGFESQRIVGGPEGVCDFDAKILRGRR